VTRGAEVRIISTTKLIAFSVRCRDTFSAFDRDKTPAMPCTTRRNPRPINLPPSRQPASL